MIMKMKMIVMNDENDNEEKPWRKMIMVMIMMT